MDKVVCSRDSRECMIHRCPKCPGIKGLKDFLLRDYTGDSKGQ